MSITAAVMKFLSNSIVRNFVAPFLPGTHLVAVSVDGGTLYGANHPGDRNAAKYEKIIWNQASANTSVFALRSTLGTLPNVTDADAANQLRWIATIDGVPLLRVDGDTAPAAGQWALAAGGGTGVGETEAIIDATGEVGATTVDIRLNDAETGTETIALGDILNFDGSDLDYVVTIDDFAFDDDNPVSISFSPALDVEITAETAVTIIAGDGRTAILGDGDLTDFQELEIYALTAADIETTTLTAGKEAETVIRTFLFSPDSVTIARK